MGDGSPIAASSRMRSLRGYIAGALSDIGEVGKFSQLFREIVSAVFDFIVVY